MTRREFAARLDTLASPVLAAAARDRLRETMSVEEKQGANRKPFAVLEALGRLLCGLAPWLEADITDPEELAVRDRLREQAQQAVCRLADPAANDYGGFGTLDQPYSQILVDTAFLAQAILRAPRALWAELPEEARRNLLAAFRLTRRIRAHLSNWLLFSTEIEAVLKKYTGEYDPHTVRGTLRLLDSWYCGDGWYSDGPSFAFDYYNSLVIHPMLLDLVRAFPELVPAEPAERIATRAGRYGQCLERLIAADGTFIAAGRSIAYRCGAFHLLALLALEERLPEGLSPAGVREALGAVIARTLAPASYRPDGFLAIGLCGTQPGLGEDYICTGSLYLASAAFLPLGLPAENPFWADPAAGWSQKRIWAGEDMPCDHGIA